MAKRVVTCQTCGGLQGLVETCEQCEHAGAFVVDDDVEDPNRYGPNGALGPRPPAPGLWVSAAAPPVQTPPVNGGVPIIMATVSGAAAVQPNTTSDLYME